MIDYVLHTAIITIIITNIFINVSGVKNISSCYRDHADPVQRKRGLKLVGILLSRTLISYTNRPRQQTIKPTIDLLKSSGTSLINSPLLKSQICTLLSFLHDPVRMLLLLGEISKASPQICGPKILLKLEKILLKRTGQ